MAVAANSTRLDASDRVVRAARVANVAGLSGNQRDAKLAYSRLVSASATLRFEFLRGKSGRKAFLIAFTDRCQPGLLAAAFKPRDGRVIAGFGRLGESYVAARPPLGERRLGDC